MRVAALLALGFILSGCAIGGTKTTTVTVTHTVTTTPTPGADDAGYFGSVASLTRVNAKDYVLVLMPKFFLVGVTANVSAAATQQIACAPLTCPGVPDDHVVVPAGSEDLTFVLPVKATGTVITPQMKNESITAAQLAALVAGAKTPKLVEPLDSGVWLAVNGDSVTSFAQEFQP